VHHHAAGSAGGEEGVRLVRLVRLVRPTRAVACLSTAWAVWPSRLILAFFRGAGRCIHSPLPFTAPCRALVCCSFMGCRGVRGLSSDVWKRAQTHRTTHCSHCISARPCAGNGRMARVLCAAVMRVASCVPRASGGRASRAKAAVRLCAVCVSLCWVCALASLWGVGLTPCSDETRWRAYLLRLPYITTKQRCSLHMT